MGFDLKEFLNLNNKQKQQNQPRPASTAMPQKTLPQFNMPTNNLSQPRPVNNLTQPQVASTAQPTFKPFDNSLTRGLSRTYDQVNPLDNSRTWQQTAPTNTKSTWQQGTKLGGDIVRGTAPGIIKSVNTAKAGTGGLLGLGEIGLSSVFGSDQNYQNTLNNVNNTLRRDLAPNSGAFGLGTGFKDYNEALNATPLDIAKKSVRYGAQDYLEGASLFTGAPVGDAIIEKGIVQGVKSQIPNLAKSALLNTAQGGITAFNQGAGRKDILKNAALSGFLGTTGDIGTGVVGAVISKAARPGITAVTTNLVDKTKLSPGLSPLNQGGFIKNPFAKEPKPFIINNPDGANINGFKINNGTGAPLVQQPPKTFQINDPYNFQGKPLKVVNNTGAPLVGENLSGAAQQSHLGKLSNDQAGFIAPGQIASDIKDFGNKLKSRLSGNQEQSPIVPPKQEVPIVGQNLSRSSKLKPGEISQTENIPLSGKSKMVSGSSIVSPHELNVNKFNITQEGKKVLSEIQTGLKKQIESVRGGKLTNQEVRQHMEASRTILKDPKTRAATKDYIAGLQNLREDNAALLNRRGSGSLTVEESARLNSGLLKQYRAAADAGRTLQSFREVANPRERTVLDVMIKKIASTDANMKEVQVALNKLGPDSTPKQQAEFYRTFVKATKEDWLDKYRYTNMLSSPLTHIVNTSSNMAGVFGVAPIQKLYEGVIDTARSTVTGGPRTRFTGEAGSYIKGSTKAIPDALRNFRDVMLDKKVSGNPDMNSLLNIPLATRGPKATADKVLSFVPKLLEAGDQFATTLSRGGEEAGLLKRASKGVKVDVSPESLSKLTDDAARYRLFRQELNKQGQGHLLDAIDIPAQTISKMRQSKNPYVRNISKFTIPFVATPTNIFKQGIEYSPLGVFTLHGNADKTTQMAKMLMGTTTIGTAVGALGAGGNITFGEPTDSNQRNAFRAEGKQPYSFKLPGSDKWINYSKMHPAISMNLAIVGAVKDAQDKGSLSDSEAEKIMNSGAGIINYFTDQSYMKNVGDFVNILSGKDNVSSGSVISSTATNNINQLAPFKSFVSWVGRQVDPTQRKISSKDPAWLQTYQGVVKDIPVLNKDIATRKDPYTGQDLKNPLPVFNSFSPNKVSIDKGFGNTTGLNPEQRQQNRDLPVNQREPFRRNVIEQKTIEKQTTLEKTTMESGKSTSTKSNNQSQVGGVTNDNIKQLSNGKFYTQVDGKYTSYDTKEKAQKAINVSNFKSSNEKKKLVGDTYYLKNDSEQGYTTVKKNEYDFNQNDSKINLEMDRAKSAGNVSAWLDNAQNRYVGYDKLLKSYDPETEQDKINNLTKKMKDLKDQVNTYKNYGGFKKGKTKSGTKYNLTKIMTTGVGSSSELRNIVKSSKIVRKKVKR